MTWGNFTVKNFSPKVFVGAGGINCILAFTLDPVINYENNERINEIRVRFEEGIVDKGELERIGKALLGKEILVGDLEIIKNCSSSVIFTAEGMKLKSVEDYRKLIREFIGENVETNFGTIQNLAEVWKIKKYKLYSNNMTNTRNILLIGRTGNGKSTLGNVLINKNGRFEEIFTEGEFGVSQTHETKTEEFWENGIRYQIIDTVGIGDTEMDERQVLYKIAEAAYKVRDGLNQVLFVTKGRFTKEEVFTYNLLREIIFDADIVNYTTIVRTNFSNFRNSGKCETDRIKMIGENHELGEVIKSCKKVVHVDNSPMNIDDELELSVNKRKREESRSKILVHLNTNCCFNYKPRNLNNLNSRIANHMTELEKLQKQLREASNLNDQQRRQMQNEIDELRGKVSESTKGFFQKTVGKVGEGVGYLADKAVQVVVYPVKKIADNCGIM